VKIDAVTFDFWQTLVSDTPENLAQARGARLEALSAVLARAGCGRPASAIEAAYERCGTEMTERFWSRDRDCTIEHQVRTFFDCLEVGLIDRLRAELLAAAVAAYARPVLTWPPVLSPGATAAVRGLAARGLRLGIVSNTGRTPGMILRRVLERHDLLRFFDAIAYSDEIGARKPSPVIFRWTLSALGIAPAATLHVGDSAHADVVGARSAGMRAAHYAPDGRGAAEADLVVTDLAGLPAQVAALAG
jgi:putative hydrolase of the HAD superfamily